MDEFKLFVYDFLLRYFYPKIRDEDVSVKFYPIKNTMGEWIKLLWIPKIIVKQRPKLNYT